MVKGFVLVSVFYWQKDGDMTFSLVSSSGKCFMFFLDHLIYSLIFIPVSLIKGHPYLLCINMTNNITTHSFHSYKSVFIEFFLVKYSF